MSIAEGIGLVVGAVALFYLAVFVCAAYEAVARWFRTVTRRNPV